MSSNAGVVAGSQAMSIVMGHKEMSSILADQLRPCIWAQMRGDVGGGRGVSGKERVQLCTLSPNKLWRSNSTLTYVQGRSRRINLKIKNCNLRNILVTLHKGSTDDQWPVKNSVSIGSAKYYNLLFVCPGIKLHVPPRGQGSFRLHFDLER